MKNEIDKRRIGRVLVSDFFYETEPEILKRVLNKLVVDHIRHDKFRGMREYTVLSDDCFRDVAKGDKIPEYKAEIAYNGVDAVINFVEVDEK